MSLDAKKAILNIALSLTPSLRKALRAEFEVLQVTIGDDADLYPVKPKLATTKPQNESKQGQHWGLRWLNIECEEEGLNESWQYNIISKHFNITNKELATKLRNGNGRCAFTIKLEKGKRKTYVVTKV